MIMDILNYIANGIALLCIACLVILMWAIFDDTDKHGY